MSAEAFEESLFWPLHTATAFVEAANGLGSGLPACLHSSGVRELLLIALM